jgi:hypothetical protein
MTPHAESTVAAPAAAAHDALVAAYLAQRERLWPASDMWAGTASEYKPNLQAPLNKVQHYVASHLREDDTLIDVGGGAGRISLPLAGECHEIVCVDPSPGMGEIFEAAVREAGIVNARFVLGSWVEAGGVEGDVALVSHVTYFVPAIAAFIEKLNAAVRRRVIIATRSAAPPNRFAPLFKLVRGEELAPVPGADDLLAVLREMALPADVVDLGEALPPATVPIGKTPDDAMRLEAEGGVRLGWLRQDEIARFTELVRPRFDELYALVADGYRLRATVGARELIITWETPPRG